MRNKLSKLLACILLFSMLVVQPASLAQGTNNITRTNYGTSLKEAIGIQVMKSSPQAWVSAGVWRNATVAEVTKFINPMKETSARVSEIVVDTSVLNVRSGAGTSYSEVGKIYRGGKYPVLKEQNGWYQINLGNNTSGWVSGVYVKTITSTTSNDNDENLQFLVLSGTSGISLADLDKELVNAGILKGHGATFLQAAKEADVNELYLIAHSLLETGNGSSPLSRGIMVDKVDGKPVEAKRVYNMFGIGARDQDPNRLGSEMAYKQGWDTPEKAIIGGAKWIGNDYIHSANKQNTLYKMRWNPANPGVKQYATDVNWANAQTKRLQTIVDLCNKYGLALNYDIPVYSSGLGKMKTGWVESRNKKYYVSNTGDIQTGWRFLGGKWYYLADDGPMRTGWLETGDKWYYLNENGVMQTGWTFAGGNWFYLNGSGAMQTGWLQDGGNKYYLSPSGVMHRGWKQDQGKWYYFNGSGIMQTGWIEVAGKKYHLLNDGSMETGWKFYQGKWRYLDKSGKMSTGWLDDAGNRYFMSNDGGMYRGWLLNNGTWYHFNGSGIMQKDWRFLGGKWYYFQKDGSMAANTTIEGYKLGSDGTIQYKSQPAETPQETPIGKKSIVIDPGHGGNDGGASGNGNVEKDINLQIARKLEIQLKNLDYDVIMTRSTDEFLELAERTKLANEANVEIFVSIHSNAAEASAAQGIETFYYSGSEKGKDLATFIQKEVISATGARDRGAKKGNYHVIRETNMPATLIEVGFISNPEESAKIADGAYQNKIVSGIVKGIEQYFNKY